MSDKVLNILLVDDHTIVRKGMKLLIESEFTNAKIYDAINGRNALELINKINFDLVITDITMPDINGIELCRKAIDKIPTIKILVMSMHLDEMYIKEAIEAGAKGYLAKSMDNEMEILTGIETILQGNTFYGKKTSKILINAMFSDSEKKITPKEVEIIRFLSDGLVYKEIAHKMNISTRTVETYRKNILEKLNLNTTAGIIKYAIKHGLVILD